ncbi:MULTISPECIES: YaiI/YqxD family protein [Bacillus]|uniref:YaiI/YqxD family protein n=1 Tax=Bacillus TaxID=1386 RepID=UPI00080E5CA3|nr:MULTISPECIES: YaiI/YqxD family protein [Bacillus]MCJ2147666.1 YaiI/YqxD family protein [Bacillus sp. B19-2]MDN5386742.1 YaiI/YqxD family protein [Bacillus sp. LB7]MEC1023990.1 YaiI/YqxD family protein [Bacillus paralicheniformis]MEC1024848.1 YaiI/YqxD family protein [Bacillus paralicheniformis]MEC1033565.1 YaiI/YqxD family protein [Bacillus paralicheniformis]
MEGWRISLLEKERTIFVDADACPVKDEVLKTAADFDVKVVFVASFEHFQVTRKEEENWTYVDPHKEAADLYIANHVRPGDVVVTQDIGLASLLLGKKVYVMSERGFLFEEDTIDHALFRRHVAQKLRRSGRYTKGPKKLVKEDRERFVKELQKILSKIEGFTY